MNLNGSPSQSSFTTNVPASVSIGHSQDMPSQSTAVTPSGAQPQYFLPAVFQGLSQRMSSMPIQQHESTQQEVAGGFAYADPMDESTGPFLVPPGKKLPLTDASRTQALDRLDKALDFICKVQSTRTYPQAERTQCKRDLEKALALLQPDDETVSKSALKLLHELLEDRFSYESLDNDLKRDLSRVHKQLAQLWTSTQGDLAKRVESSDKQDAVLRQMLSNHRS